jgi:hypothetical protein
MESSSKRKTVVAGAAAFLVAVGAGAYLLLSGGDEGPVAGPETVYYTGPMKSKSGDHFGSADGKPASKQEADAAGSRFLESRNARK